MTQPSQGHNGYPASPHLSILEGILPDTATYPEDVTKFTDAVSTALDAIIGHNGLPNAKQREFVFTTFWRGSEALARVVDWHVDIPDEDHHLKPNYEFLVGTMSRDLNSLTQQVATHSRPEVQRLKATSLESSPTEILTDTNKMSALLRRVADVGLRLGGHIEGGIDPDLIPSLAKLGINFMSQLQVLVEAHRIVEFDENTFDDLTRIAEAYHALDEPVETN